MINDDLVGGFMYVFIFPPLVGDIKGDMLIYGCI